MNKIDTVSLDTLCSAIIDCPHSTPIWKDEGVFVIRNYNIRQGCLSFNEASYVDEQTYNERIRRAKPESGDLVISREAPMGAVCMIPEGVKCCLGQRLVLLKINKDVCDSNYLLYALQSQYVQAQIDAINKTGSIVSNLNIPDLKSLQIPFVDKEKQIKIGSALASIVDKIQLNNRIITELEEMAKTIYDYWFVQFDFPNAEGKPYRSSGGAVVWNDRLNREIPKGWEVKYLAEIESDIITGKTPPTQCPENYNGDIPFITIGDIRNNVFVTSTEITLSKQGADSQPTKYIPEDSICVTCIASPGLIGFTTERSQTNQQINTVVCKNKYNRYFLYFALNNYFQYANGAKTGSTFANMNKDDFSTIEILKPEIKLLQQYYGVIDPLFQKIKESTMETKYLSMLRDWLLPMLMNGQVTVK